MKKYCEEIKQIAENLDVLTRIAGDNYFEVELKVWGDTYGRVKFEFDFEEEKFTVNTIVSQDQFCAIFNIGYDEIQYYLDDIEEFNTTQTFKTLEEAITEAEDFLDAINDETEVLEENDYEFIDAVRDMIDSNS